MRITSTVDMKRVALILCIFRILLLSPRVRADWADERKNNLAASLEEGNGRLHEPFWTSANTKNTDPSSATNSHTPNGIVPTTADFSEIRYSQAFVDKTFFLHEWLTHQPKHWYVTAPPGFGKSTLASMAIQFLNASVEIVDGTERFHDKTKTTAYELFRGTNIFSMKEYFAEHFQNYAVIYIDLAPLGNTTVAVYRNPDDFRSQSFHINFKTVIKKMMNYYPSLLHHQSLNESERNIFKEYLEEGMEMTNVRPSKFWFSASFLMKLLRRCLKRDVIVLVDSYDSLCLPSMMGGMLQIQRPYIASYIINFSKMIIQDKQSTVLYFGSFNTLELMLKKPSEQLFNSSMYTVEHTEFSSDERIAKYFGMCERDVVDVLNKYSMQDHFEILDDLLNGHAVVKSSLTLFNTRAVLSYIENQNATPRALALPLTVKIMQYYGKLLTSQWISNFLTECIFKNASKIVILPAVRVSFATFTRLKKLIDDASEIPGREPDPSLENSLSLIRILQSLGLISVINQRTNEYDFRASSRSDAEFMNDFLYDSGNVQKLFRISAEDELAMISAMKNIGPTNESVESLGKAVCNIVKTKVPEAEYQLKSLMYVYAKMVATRHAKDIALEAGIATPREEHLKINGVCKSGLKEKIDLILILKNKGIGIILTSELNTNATSLLKKMIDHRYCDILDSNFRFSKLKIKEKILIGITVSQDKSVEIAAEVRQQNNKTNLIHVVLNKASYL